VVFIKICGTSNRKDAEETANLADMIGLIISDSTRGSRSVSRDEATEIVKGLPAKKVAVINPKTSAQAISLSKSLNMNYIEVYNHLKPATLKKIKEHTRVIKGFKVPGKKVERLKEEIDAYKGCYDILLLDTGYGKEMKNGWETSAAIRDYVYPKKVMIDGGLTPDNVAKAIKKIRPWAVDVSAGVERRPGKKSFEKMRHFCRVVRRFRYGY
jgi:phosphoribosylanthranilate isomerase